MAYTDTRVSRRSFLCGAAAMGTAGALAPSLLARGLGPSSSPNLIVILTDDQGYGDVGCYGSTTVATPRIDQMASEGTKFTSFYVGASICSPARACLLTGSYGARVRIYQSIPSGDSLNPNEYTLAQVLKSRGYATCGIGKKHLGGEFGNGSRYGFDEWRGEVADETRADSCATQAISFINAHSTEPFFLYVAHTSPHVPLHEGNYVNAVEAIDASVGRILDAVDAAGISDNTCVVFYSDNGPWLDPCADMNVNPCTPEYEGGDAGPLRGGKFGCYEGGHRVPCIMRWPNTIPAGAVCDEMATGMDFYPTWASLTGAQIPVTVRFQSGAERPWVLDGKDIYPLMTAQPGATTPHETYAYYQLWQMLQSADYCGAIRSGNWKLHPQRSELYNLATDVGETTNLYNTETAAKDAMLDYYRLHIPEMRENYRPVYRISDIPEPYTAVLGSVSTSPSRYRPARTVLPQLPTATYDLMGRGRPAGASGIRVTPRGRHRAVVR